MGPKTRRPFHIKTKEFTPKPEKQSLSFSGESIWPPHDKAIAIPFSRSVAASTHVRT